MKTTNSLNIRHLLHSQNFCLLPTWSEFELVKKGSVSHYNPLSHLVTPNLLILSLPLDEDDLSFWNLEQLQKSEQADE